MTATSSIPRRWLADRSVLVTLAVLLAGSLLVGAIFLPAYLAIALASGIRNLYVPWLGNGAAFYAVAFVGLYVQAVVLAGLFRAGRHVYRALRADEGNAAI